MRVIIVRACDFFGPRSGNNRFAQGMVKPGRTACRVLLPAAPGVGHQFAYLPDVASTMIQLLARRQALPAFARFHVGGHEDSDGTELARAVQRVVARRCGTEPTLRRFPWRQVRLAAPIVATLRELLELRYLRQPPVRMANQRLTQLLGAEPHTPLDEAIEQTLDGRGGLDAYTGGQRRQGRTRQA